MALDGFPQDLNQWVEFLSNQELPALAGSIKRLNQVAADSETARVNELARVILQEPAMTSKVLRIANSALYSQGATPVTTISRAIVLLGFSAIRDICISVKVVDGLLGRNPNVHLMETLAKSFHSATQAKNLVRGIRAGDQEEVFIAGLLTRLGETSIWSMGGETVRQLEAKLKEGVTPNLAAEAILGVRFDHLSYGLAKSWKLGELLLDALRKPQQPKRFTEAVIIGDELASYLPEGMESPRVIRLLKRVELFTGRTADEVKDLIITSAKDARATARSYGADRLVKLIPVLDGSQEETDADETTIQKLVRGDPELQSRILQELTQIESNKSNINIVMSTVVEGIVRGIGMDRVALALCTPDRSGLRIKHVLGDQKNEWNGGEKFNISLLPENLFSYVIKAGRAVWAGDASSKSLNYLNTPPIQAISGFGEFFAAPIIVKGKCIGLFYADQRPTSTPLKSSQFNAFSLFAEKAGETLSRLA